jgi:DNA repair protein RecN (Recombination protein N)
MLLSLRIENFAIVSFLDLDFHAGMTAFTGETGAGKSIMIDALMLAFGGRAESSVIRQGADKCEVIATFSYSENSLPAQWLTAHEIESAEKEIILRRVILKEGRSKSYINGLPFPVQKLKELAETLVDIHGQHQHQSLLNHATHRQQLDNYANHASLLSQVATYYKECQNIKEKIAHLKNQNRSEEKEGLLQYQLEEIQSLSIQENEFLSLQSEHQLLHHARAYLENCEKIISVIDNEEATSVLKGLNHALNYLAGLPAEQPTVQSAKELLKTAVIQCEEAVNEVEQFSNQIDLDPEKLQQVEERMSALHQLARKFQIDPCELHSLQQKLEAELGQLKEQSQLLLQMEKELNNYQTLYKEAADALHEARLLAGVQLAKEITQTIQKLGMPQGFIRIDITPLEKMSPHGADKVEYKVCTNPGMQPDILSKVASGGELSRISLAIQLITAQNGSTPTLLFDEVDVGIGGATAALVGQYLQSLGERMQLFCVTHQPQVAACAHHHFYVEKVNTKEQAFSKVAKLDSSARVDEIARMLGGLTITNQTKSSARELLLQAQPA